MAVEMLPLSSARGFAFSLLRGRARCAAQNRRGTGHRGRPYADAYIVEEFTSG